MQLTLFNPCFEMYVFYSQVNLNGHCLDSQHNCELYFTRLSIDNLDLNLQPLFFICMCLRLMIRVWSLLLVFNEPVKDNVCKMALRGGIVCVLGDVVDVKVLWTLMSEPSCSPLKVYVQTARSSDEWSDSKSGGRIFSTRSIC